MGLDDRNTAVARLAELEHPCKGDVYHHYRGGHYAVIAVGLHNGTLVPLVVYEDDRHPERGVWVRTLADFVEPVTLADGETRPRFLLIAE